MGVRLTVSPRERGDVDGDESGGETGDARYEFEQDRILIGRGAGADVRLPHPSVSMRHATIEQRGGRYVIVDHGATNGTHVQGGRLVPERPKPLRDGDRIDVGVFAIAWKEGVPVASSPTAERTASLARRLLRDVLGARAPEGARIVVLASGEGTGRALPIPLPPARLLIGRGEGCDLVLADADASREHVELVVDLDGVVARDRGSKNGVLVNDRRITERRLQDRDELLVGNTVLLFEDPTEPALRAAEQAPDERVEAPPRPEPSPEDGARQPADDPDAPTGEPAGDAAGATGASGGAPERAPSAGAPGRIAPAELIVYVLATLVFLASIAGLVALMRAE